MNETEYALTRKNLVKQLDVLAQTKWKMRSLIADVRIASSPFLQARNHVLEAQSLLEWQLEELDKSWGLAQFAV